MKPPLWRAACAGAATTVAPRGVRALRRWASCSAGVVSCSIGCSIGKASRASATPGSVGVRRLNSSAVLSLACSLGRERGVKRPFEPRGAGIARVLPALFGAGSPRIQARLSTIGLARARHKLVPSRPSGQPRCDPVQPQWLRSDLARCYAARSRRAPACLQARVRASPSAFDPCEEGLPSWQPLPRPVHRGSVDRMPVCRRVIDVPNLIDIQVASFRRFMEEGLREVIDDISPIEDYTGTLAVEFGEYAFDPPPVSIRECREKDLTYSAPLSVTVRFINKSTGEIREQRVFMGDFPLMTEWGTFIINGTERVVVTQLVRSPGAYILEPKDAAKQLFTANLMPSRGSWLELEIDKKGLVTVRIDRKRKLPITTLLRALPHEDPTTGFVHGHDVQRGDRRPLPRSQDQGREPLHRVHAREGHHDARRRGADRGLQEAAPRRAADARQRARPPALALLRPQALRPHEGRPLQAEPAPARLGRHAGRRPADPDGRARAHHARHPDARAQARLAARHARRPARLARLRRRRPQPASAIRSRTSSTSTSTSATAACATSAS